PSCSCLQLPVYDAAPVTRLPGSESGPCFAVSYSRRPHCFPPPTPPRRMPLCSSASQVLSAGPTSPIHSWALAHSLPHEPLRPAGEGRSETSRFPIRRRPRMPGSADDAEPAGTRSSVPVRVAFCRLESISAPNGKSFVAQWLAYVLPCQRFTCGLATDRA